MQAEGAIDRQPEDLRLEGFGEEIVGAKPDGAQRIGLVVLAGQHDNLGVRRQSQQLFEQAKALRYRIGIGRQAEIHGDDRGRVAAHLVQGALTIIGDDDFILVEGPANLFLQGRIVFDNQQGAGFSRCHEFSNCFRSDDFETSISGNLTKNRVPAFSLLSTRMSPPSSCTYWRLSYAPIPMPACLVV